MKKAPTTQSCDECGAENGPPMYFCRRDWQSNQSVRVCAECIRVAGIILARAEKDAANDDVPAPEVERK